MHSCEVCCAMVSELRRGRCWGCYARWVDARPVGIGARCVTCTEKRRKFLKSVELYGHWQPMCFNCAGQLLHIQPLPLTMAELKVAVSRERRRQDRRIGKPDTRVFQYERRVGERRASRAEYPAVDDDMIIEVTIDGTEDPGFEDLTQIRELISDLRPDELEAAPTPRGKITAERIAGLERTLLEAPESISEIERSDEIELAAGAEPKPMLELTDDDLKIFEANLRLIDDDLQIVDLREPRPPIDDDHTGPVLLVG